MLGFGFDVSEFDLWWLLNRKKRERSDTGGTWYFSPAERLEAGEINEKEELLRVLGVEVRNCGMTRSEGGPLVRSRSFRVFYDRALGEIEELMRERRQQN